MAYVDAKYTGASSSTVNATAPTGIQDGDILIGFGTGWKSGGGSGAIGLPAGFTSIAARTTVNFQSAVGWKRASSESGTYAFTSSTATSMQAIVAAYRGRLSAGDPVDVYSDTAYIVNDTIVRAAAMTVATAAVDIIWVAFSANDITKPTAFTLRVEDPGTGANDYALLSDLLNQGTGSTGDVDGSISAAISKHAYMVALKPVAEPSWSGLTIYHTAV